MNNGLLGDMGWGREDSSVLCCNHGLGPEAVSSRQHCSYLRMQPKTAYLYIVIYVVYVFRFTLNILALLCGSDPKILNSSESSYSAIATLIFTAVKPSISFSAVTPAFPPKFGTTIN